MSRTSATEARRLRFGVHGSYQLATNLLAAVRHDPEQVTFVPYDVREPFAGLRAGDIDVMIVKYALQEPDVAFSATVAFDGRAVIVAEDHPLAAREAVSVEEVADYDAFDRPGTFPPYVWDQVVPPTTPLGRPIRRVPRMTTMEETAAILRRTRAVHLSFRSLAAAALPGITVVPVHDLPPAPVSLAWLRNRKLPASVREFITEAERSAQR
ncbi:substrate-binding domain-containing protein [Streptomyces sp. NPDC057376]|uniref:substrate-binding domain-containing protein n=1 Tax=unclassified Streptomyces TaxID=2593676 RepID=UPI00363CF4CD